MKRFPYYVKLGIIGLGALSMLFPLVITISTSLKLSGAEISWPPTLIPKPVVWKNYLEVWTIVPFLTFLKNSCIITAFNMVGRLFSSLLIGYAFARLRFPGRDALFMVCISTMMLPSVVTLIPTFVLFRMLGWVDTLLPMIVPTYFGSAFLIFLSRQFLSALPMEYDEAARIDGANTLQIWWKIIIPSSVPLIGTILIYSFSWDWNDFMGPLIYLQSHEKYTLALGLRSFMGYISFAWNHLMAGTMIMIIPVLIVFFFAQRYFIEGMTMSGLTGR